jgi:hypothetical protein
LFYCQPITRIRTRPAPAGRRDCLHSIKKKKAGNYYTAWREGWVNGEDLLLHYRKKTVQFVIDFLGVGYGADYFLVDQLLVPLAPAMHRHRYGVWLHFQAFGHDVVVPGFRILDDERLQILEDFSAPGP